MTPFWMVVVDGESSPNKRYTNPDEAKMEAGRLATKMGKRAWLIHTVAYCDPAVNVTWSEL